MMVSQSVTGSPSQRFYDSNSYERMLSMNSDSRELPKSNLTARPQLMEAFTPEYQPLPMGNRVEKRYYFPVAASNVFPEVEHNLMPNISTVSVSADLNELIIETMHNDSTVDQRQEISQHLLNSSESDRIPIGTYNSRLPNGKKWGMYPCLKKPHSKSITEPAACISNMKLQALGMQGKRHSFSEASVRRSLDSQSSLRGIESAKEVVTAPQLLSLTPDLSLFHTTKDSDTRSRYIIPVDTCYQLLSTGGDWDSLSYTSCSPPCRCLEVQTSHISLPPYSLLMSSADGTKRAQSYMQDASLPTNSRMDTFGSAPAIPTLGLPQPPLINRGPLNSHPPISALSPSISSITSPSSHNSSSGHAMKVYPQKSETGGHLTVTTDYVKPLACSNLEKITITPQNRECLRGTNPESCKGIKPERKKLRKPLHKQSSSLLSMCQTMQTTPVSSTGKAGHDSSTSASILTRLIPSVDRYDLSIKRRPLMSRRDSPVPMKRVSLHPKLASAETAFEELSGCGNSSVGISQAGDGFTRYPIDRPKGSQEATKSSEQCENGALPYIKGLKDWDDCVLEEATTEEDKFVSNLATLGVLKKDYRNPRKLKLKEMARVSGNPRQGKMVSIRTPGRKLKQGIREALFVKRLQGASLSRDKSGSGLAKLRKNENRKTDGQMSSKFGSLLSGNLANSGSVNDDYGDYLERTRLLYKYQGRKDDGSESVDEFLSQSDRATGNYEKSIPVEVL